MTDQDHGQDHEQDYDRDTVDLLDELLDRLVVGPDGVSVGMVDNLELRTRADGRLEVAALLVGTEALEERLEGWTRRLVRLGARLCGGPDQTRTIPIDEVTEIGTDVRVTERGAELAASPAERRIRRRLIGRIPGAGDAGE